MNTTSVTAPATGIDSADERATGVPLTGQYPAAVERRTAAASPGNWAISRDGYGIPMGFGPFSWVRAWNEGQLEADVAFCTAAPRDIRALVGEIRRLRTEASRAARATARRARFLSPLSWAAFLDAADLGEFLGDLATAADGSEDLTTLATVERVITSYRRAYARNAGPEAI